MTPVKTLHDPPEDARLGGSGLAFSELAGTDGPYRTMVEQIPAIMYTEIDDPSSDTGSWPVFISPQVEAILGYTAAELLEDPDLWNGLTHPDDVQTLMGEGRLDEALGIIQYEYRMITRWGEVRWFRDQSRHLDDAETGQRFWQVVILDITAEKAAKDAARDAQLRYRSLVEALPVVVFIDAADERSTNVYTSPYAETMTGYTAEEWMSDGELWSRTIHPEDRERVLAAHNSGEPVFDQEYRLIRKDGRTIWVRDFATDVPDDDGRVLWTQGFMMEVTDRKEADAATQRSLERESRAAEQLRALDRMKSTVLRTLQQDLRQPLAAVLAAAVTLEAHGSSLSEEERGEMLSALANRARAMDEMLTVLLDLHRLEHGSVEPNRRPIDLAVIVGEGVAGFEALRGREVELSLAPAQVWADPEKVTLILDHLLQNAVRHTPADRRVWISVTPTDGGAILAVDDDGPGVADDLKVAIFDAFRQGDTDAAVFGMGLGLSFVARFAEMHGGRAWMEDRPGGGASFRVFLPA